MILEEETFEEFGYHPSDLKPKSCKKIFVACDDCGKVRAIRKEDYQSLCASCVKKGARSHLWKGGLVKRTCEACGIEFPVDPNVVKRGEGIYCSNSCAKKGKNNPMFGRMGKNNPNYGKHPSEETKQKQSEFASGEGNPFFGKHHSKEARLKMCKARKHRKFPTHHTKPELIFEAISKKYNLSFKYTGDGSFWIKNINPDFVESYGKKICVEIFGDYWHSPILNRNMKVTASLEYRKRFYKRFKWVAIFIWETDLLREDAEQFVLNKLRNEGAIK